jgi:hypothetical protein
VRSQEKAAVLGTLGVRPVIGSLDDEQLLVDEVSKADAVVQIADADNLNRLGGIK